jgi:hypothetical protein
MTSVLKARGVRDGKGQEQSSREGIDDQDSMVSIDDRDTKGA